MAESASLLQVKPRLDQGRRLPSPTLKQLWLELPIFLMILKAFLFPLPLLDFWWHLKMGQIILDTRSIPRIDIFSFTAAGMPFIVQNWLAEIIFYVTHRAGGAALLILLNTLLLVATLLPVYHLCQKASDRLWPGVLSACLVAASITCNLRPQVFSFLLFAMFYWLISDFCRSQRDRIWMLPVLMVLWVNLHGAFALGLAVIGIHLFAEFIRTISNHTAGQTLGRQHLGRLALILVLCGVATLANPEGYRIYDYVSTVMQDPSSQKFVVEWQPPVITAPQGIFQFYLPWFLVTLAMIFSRQRPDLMDAALYVGFSILGLTSTRNSTWFVLIAAPIFARHASFFDPSSMPFLRKRTETDGEPAKDRGGKREVAILNLAIAGMGFALICVQSPWVQSRVYGASLLDANTPVGAVDFIEKHPLKGNIFHPQFYGDYLIWRLWPAQRSFLDGRVHLFGESLVKDYQRIYSDSNWADLLTKYAIRYLLLSKQADRQEDRRLIEEARGSADWRILYEDDRSVLLEKAVH